MPGCCRPPITLTSSVDETQVKIAQIIRGTNHGDPPWIARQLKPASLLELLIPHPSQPGESHIVRQVPVERILRKKDRKPELAVFDKTNSGR
jgi:hypothetical protein